MTSNTMVFFNRLCGVLAAEAQCPLDQTETVDSEKSSQEVWTRDISCLSECQRIQLGDKSDKGTGGKHSESVQEASLLTGFVID